MNRDKLVFWFIKNYNDLHLDMMKSNHTFFSIEPNPYHAVNTVWAHTMMVMTWVEAKFKDDVDYITLITTALLHDTGKPSCQTLKEPNIKSNKPERYAFNGHEGVSTFKSVGILKKLQNDFPEVYTDTVIKCIIKLVSLHGVHNEGLDFIELREKFRECDKMGAIRRDTDVQDQYPGRKFAKMNSQNGRNLIILCGLPCSGKSTYFRNELINTHTIISRDSEMYNFLFIEKVFVRTHYNTDYNAVYEMVHKSDELLTEFNQFFDKKLNAISKEKDNVCIDMTMLSLKSRRNMLNKFKKFNAECILFMPDLETINGRNCSRFEKEGKYISDGVYENMMKSFTYPVVEEGFNKIELILN
jgi:hypothetical protein